MSIILPAASLPFVYSVAWLCTEKKYTQGQEFTVKKKKGSGKEEKNQNCS